VDAISGSGFLKKGEDDRYGPDAKYRAVVQHLSIRMNKADTHDSKWKSKKMPFDGRNQIRTGRRSARYTVFENPRESAHRPPAAGLIAWPAGKALL
jgi:hypothetical protein